MSPHRWTAAALLIGIGIGYAFQGGNVEPIASAQNNATTRDNPSGPAENSAIGRFQISAWGAAPGHGCYMVDTASGDLWLVRENRSPEHISKSRSARAP